MKTQKEIESKSRKFYRTQASGGGQYTEGFRDGLLRGFVDGYNECQKDISGEKYSEEDLQKVLDQFTNDSPGFYLKTNFIERLQKLKQNND